MKELSMKENKAKGKRPGTRRTLICARVSEPSAVGRNPLNCVLPVLLLSLAPGCGDKARNTSLAVYRPIPGLMKSRRPQTNTKGGRATPKREKKKNRGQSVTLKLGQLTGTKQP